MKLFEEFKQNNEAGDLISSEDIINAKKSGEKIYATIIEDVPDNDPKEPLEIKDIDEDGLITVEVDGKQYNVDLNDVEKIEF